MAGDHEAQDIVATSDEFRDLAKTVGIKLNIALQGHIASADKTKGYVLANFQDQMKIIQEVVIAFERNVCIDRH